MDFSVADKHIDYKANETYTKLKFNSEQLYGKYHVIIIEFYII